MQLRHCGVSTLEERNMVQAACRHILRIFPRQYAAWAREQTSTPVRCRWG